MQLHCMNNNYGTASTDYINYLQQTLSRIETDNKILGRAIPHPFTIHRQRKSVPYLSRSNPMT